MTSFPRVRATLAKISIVKNHFLGGDVTKRQQANFLRIAVVLAFAACVRIIPAHAQTLTTIYSFSGSNDGGDSPLSPLAFASGATAYGSTAIGGGTSEFGAVYELVAPTKSGSTWNEAVLYRLGGGIDGQQPQDIALGQSGELFSSTLLGGTGDCYQGCGTVFELIPPAEKGGAWIHTILYDFAEGTDGVSPGNVVIGQNGSVYGSTSGGGPGGASPCTKVGCGILFELTPPSDGGSWTRTVLYSFPRTKSDGRNPNADIVFDSNGNLYGTTYSGGSGFYGTVFELSPPAAPGSTWTETILHNFTGKSGDGGYPIGGLTIASNGTVYGTASYSGVANDSGTAFALTPPAEPGGAWTYTVLHNFAGGSDGATPATTMAFDTTGNLYGTTWNGGSTACYLGCGTIFKLAPPAKSGGSWTETILHEWGNSGQTPDASIVGFHNGLLYGTSLFFGTSNVGSVFTLTP